MFARALARPRTLRAFTKHCPSRTLPWSRHSSVLTQAHAIGPSEPALYEDTIPTHFAGIVSKFGDRNAVISRHQQKILTYDDLDVRSNALARGFQSLGVRKGDRVAVSLGNNLEFAALTYALFKLGAILVPLNPSFNSKQIVAALKHLDAKVLIIGAETNLVRKAPRGNGDLLKEIYPGIESTGGVESEALPSLESIVLVDNSSGRIDV
ncbi:hypothetical protein LTR95_019654, partial [Oleoguttula sp. CCFEE 5521]